MPQRAAQAARLAAIAILLLSACSPPPPNDDASPSADIASPTASGAIASTPVLDGANLPASLIGTYHDAGEASVGWLLLPAGDAFCTDEVLTAQSCLRITRPSGTVDYGPMVLDGAELVVLLIFDEDGNCLATWRTTYELSEAGLDLRHGICGVPRGVLLRGEPA